MARYNDPTTGRTVEADNAKSAKARLLTKPQKKHKKVD